MNDATIRIDKNGVWYHGDTPINRLLLIRLFYSVLKKREDGYYIETPGETVPVEVEDAPYAVTSIFEPEPGKFDLFLNDESTVPLNAHHPLRISDSGLLYVTVKDNLEAGFTLNTLADIGKNFESGSDGKLRLVSYDHEFVLDPGN